MTDRSRVSGSTAGSGKIRYYESYAYPGLEPVGHKQELVVNPQYYDSSKSGASGSYVARAHSQGGTYYNAPPGYYKSSTSSRAARKYEMDDMRSSSGGSKRGCLIISIIVLIAVLVAAAVALGIVFGVVNKADKDKDTTTQRPETVVSHEASLTLDQTYSSDYDDPSTAAYTNLKNEMETGVNSLMRDSELGPSFIDATVTGFRRGSVVVLFKFDFSKTTVTNAASNTVKQISSSLVRDVLVLELPKKAAFVQAKKVQVDKTVVAILEGTGMKDLGEACGAVTECEDRHTVCQGSKCVCGEDFFDSNNADRKGGSCNPKILYEATGCTEGRHCKTPNATCLNSQCVCDQNRHFHKNDICNPKIEYEELGCTEAGHCKTSNAVCQNQRCKCDANTRFYKADACVEKIDIDAWGCTVASDCKTSGASCSSGYCKCSNDDFLKNGQCVDKIALNQVGCLSPFHCINSGTVCDSGKCVCPDNHTFKNGKCVSEKECIAWYHENTILSNCWTSYTKMTSAERSCEHYENLLGCIKYSAIVHNVECTAAQIHSIFQSNGYEICDDHTLAWLDSQMPDEKSGLCENVPTARYLLTYGCITYDIGALNADDKCRALITIQGCMFKTLGADAGCQVSDVKRLTQNSEVRAGLLENVPQDCDSRIQVTACEQHYYMYSTPELSHCFTSPLQLHFATILANVDELQNYNNQKKLKCSVYEAGIQCLISTSPYSYTNAAGQTVRCVATDLTSMFKASARMYYEIMKASGVLPAIAVALFKIIDFSECDAGLSTVIPLAVCPSTGMVADWVAGACGAQVFETTRAAKREACYAYTNFDACLKILKLPHSEKCSANHVSDAFEVHTAFFKRTLDGFDPADCKGEQSDLKCTGTFVERAKYAECAKPYGKLMFTSDQSEKCSHFTAFLMCIKFHAFLRNEACPLQTIEAIAKGISTLGAFSICQGCDYKWSVKYDNGNWAGYVNVHTDMTTSSAMVTIMAYGLNNNEWVGLGVSGDDQMTNSDIYTAQGNGDGGWTLVDRFATAKAKPQPDATSDVSEVSVHSLHGNVKIEFSRRINTVDSAKDVSLSSNRYLLFARGPMSSNDISKHSFKKVSAQKMFQCSPYSYYDGLFPDTREKICTDPDIHHFLWEYECLDFDFSTVTDPDNRCRTEISRRECVLNIFKDSELGCTMDDVTQTSQLPEVRDGLLDYVEIGCESQLADTACQMHFVVRAAKHGPNCFIPAYNFISMVYFNTVDEINGFMSASDSQKKLKCSLYEAVLTCFVSKVPTTYDNQVCTPSDMAVSLTRSMHIYYEISLLRANKPEIPFQECEANVMTQVPAKACPSHATIVDLVVGKCGAVVLTEIAKASGDACSARPAFDGCLREFKEINVYNQELCQGGYVDAALKNPTYKEYFKQRMGGFHPVDCKLLKCSAEFVEKAKTENCSKSYEKLKAATEELETCWHFQNFLGCVISHAIVYGETCLIRDIETKAKTVSGLENYSICKDCYFWWSVKNSDGNLVGEVMVRKNDEMDATVSLKAYDFDADSEWLGFGVSLDQSMANSDIYTAHKSGNTWVVTDRFAQGRTKPSPDTAIGGTDGVKKVSGEMENGHATVEFTRKADVGDDTTDLTLMSDRYFLFARGPLTNNDISKHTFKKASEKQFILQCSPYDDIDRNFPDNPQELCTHADTHHYMWQYNCLEYDIDLISDPDDRCRTEISNRQCVHNGLKGLGCTMENVIDMSQLPEVRYGVLDSVDPGCESSLQDSACEMAFYRAGALGVLHCLSPIWAFSGITGQKSVADVRGMMSASGQKSLMCSLSDLFLQCIITGIPSLQTANTGNTSCVPADMATAATATARGYHQVALQQYGIPQVPFQECEASASSQIPSPTCPTREAVVDTVMGLCASAVIAQKRAGQNPCQTFTSTWMGMNSLLEWICGNGYVMSSLVQYSNHIKQTLEGFDMNTCGAA